MKPTHLSAIQIVKNTGIKRPTFYKRVESKKIKSYSVAEKDNLYSVKDWNKKCPDYQILL